MKQQIKNGHTQFLFYAQNNIDLIPPTAAEQLRIMMITENSVQGDGGMIYATCELFVMSVVLINRDISK